MTEPHFMEDFKINIEEFQQIFTELTCGLRGTSLQKSGEREPTGRLFP